MPAFTYAENKSNIYKWREEHPAEYLAIARNNSKAYYARHKTKIQNRRQVKMAFSELCKMVDSII